MARLRDPERGCPWDLRQDFASIAPYTIEEAYEVADAAERGDPEALRDELGDLLLQVVYHAQLAAERGWFDFAAVAAGLCDKLIRRHPHVFGDAPAADAAAVKRLWEENKARERGDAAGTLAGIARALPALRRAQKLQQRAAGVGFDWPDAEGPLAKLREETAELEAALAAGGEPAALAEEIGDLLFTTVNLARHLGLDAETCLRHANDKFERRFAALERRLAAAGRRPADCDLDTLEAAWQAVKAADGGAADA